MVWFGLLVFYVTSTIFQLHMWRHRCAGGLKKKLYLRSGSQRHRHFVGFFNVPVPHRHGTNLFIRWFRHTAPFSRLLRSRWGYGGAHSRLNPPGPHGGCKIEEIWLQIWKGPLYNLSKYAVNFGLGPQIRVHRPLHFRWWLPVFANGPLFLSILYTCY